MLASNREIKLKPTDFIVSKTDTKGIITYGNKMFIQMSGYSEDELINKPHNIIRHPDMPKAIFKLLWDTVRKKEEVFAYVKNLAKDGSYYWVFTNVTASLDLNDNIIGYYSVRRKPNEEAIKIISDFYGEMVEAEKRSGVSQSTNLLLNLLNSKGVSYNEFIISIQG